MQSGTRTSLSTDTPWVAVVIADGTLANRKELTGTAHSNPPPVTEASRHYSASWKMMPSVCRWPRRMRLTPCFRFTR